MGIASELSHPLSSIGCSPHLRAPLLQELQLPLPQRRDFVRPGVGTAKQRLVTTSSPSLPGNYVSSQGKWTQKVTLWVTHTQKHTHAKGVSMWTITLYSQKISRAPKSAGKSWNLQRLAGFHCNFLRVLPKIWCIIPIPPNTFWGGLGTAWKGVPNSHRRSRSVWLDGDWISGVCFKGIKNQAKLRLLLRFYLSYIKKHKI